MRKYVSRLSTENQNQEPLTAAFVDFNIILFIFYGLILLSVFNSRRVRWRLAGSENPKRGEIRERIKWKLQSLTSYERFKVSIFNGFKYFSVMLEH